MMFCYLNIHGRGELCPDPGDDCGSSRTHHVQKLVDVNLTITVDVTHGKECLNLFRVKLGATFSELLHT